MATQSLYDSQLSTDQRPGNEASPEGARTCYPSDKIGGLRLREADDDEEPTFKLQKVPEVPSATEQTTGGEQELTLEQLWFGNLTEREQNLLRRVALFEGRVEALETLKAELYGHFVAQPLEVGSAQAPS